VPPAPLAERTVSVGTFDCVPVSKRSIVLTQLGKDDSAVKERHRIGASAPEDVAEHGKRVVQAPLSEELAPVAEQLIIVIRRGRQFGGFPAVRAASLRWPAP